MGPKRRPPRLLLAALLAATFHARWSLSLSLSFSFSLFSLSLSLYSAGPVLQPLSSLFSAVVSMLLTCPPSLTSVAEGGGGGWVARRSCRGIPPKTRKKKCCYQLRGSKKHVHYREASAGLLYECPCAACDCLP